MANQAQQPKVLRIGIIMDGKIVQERLVKQGESVTIGESAKNTFVIPKVALPRQDFPLFVPKGNKYVLQFTEQMKGKVGSGGAVVGLEKVRTDPSVERDGAIWKLALSEQDRGKISLGNITVLFQFVTAPPVAAVRATRTDFRPRLIEEDDALLFGFMCLFSAIGAIFMVWAWNVELPEPEVDRDDIAQWLSVPEEVEVKEPEVVEDEGEKAKVEPAKVEPAKVETAQRELSAEEVAAAQAAREAARKAAEEAAAKEAEEQLALLLGDPVTRGEGQAGKAADVLSKIGDSGGGPASSFEQSTGGPVTFRDAGGGAGTAERGVATGQIGVTGTSKVVDKPIVAAVQTEAGDTEMLEAGDANVVSQMVRKNSAQLKYCYEDRLKSNPDLGGRVVLTWQILNGRVTGVEVFTNTTGDAELASCVKSKVQRWQFATDTNGEVQWPFVFSRSN